MCSSFFWLGLAVRQHLLAMIVEGKLRVGGWCGIPMWNQQFILFLLSTTYQQSKPHSYCRNHGTKALSKRWAYFNPNLKSLSETYQIMTVYFCNHSVLIHHKKHHSNRYSGSRQVTCVFVQVYWISPITFLVDQAIYVDELFCQLNVINLYKMASIESLSPRSGVSIACFTQKLSYIQFILEAKKKKIRMFERRGPVLLRSSLGEWEVREPHGHENSTTRDAGQRCSPLDLPLLQEVISNWTKHSQLHIVDCSIALSLQCLWSFQIHLNQ